MQQIGLDPEIGAQILNGLPPEMLANREALITALATGVGLQALRAKFPGAMPAVPAPAAPAAAPAAPAAKPVFTETGTGRPNTPGISTLEQQQMKRAGIKPAAWQKHTAVLDGPPRKIYTLEGDD
jgi:hypothetical protein